MSTRRQQDYREDAAVAAAIAAVAAAIGATTEADIAAVAIAAAAAAREAEEAETEAIEAAIVDFVEAAIVEFAASIDNEEGMAVGMDVDEDVATVAVGNADVTIRDGDNRGDGDDDGGGGEVRVTKKRRGKKLLSDIDLLVYFETKLGSGLECSCQGNCLRILHNQVICSAVASYMVWFERKSKIEQDNIVLQWMIYGHPPGGRHSSLSTSQRTRREYGYHVPFDGLRLENDGDYLAMIRDESVQNG